MITEITITGKFSCKSYSLMIVKSQLFNDTVCLFIVVMSQLIAE